MNGSLLIVATALGASLLIGTLWEPMPYEERLIQLQLEELFPEYASELRDKPIEVRALLVDYAGDPLLVAKARVALLRYPEMAPSILSLYGADADFQEVLREYGENVLPPIYYFLTNEVRTLVWMKQAGATAGAIGEMLRGWWPGSPERGKDRPPSGSPGAEMTPEERGRYAVRFIQDEGHNFLAQFVLGPGGEVRRVQTERFLKAANTFFLGGVRTLETRYRLEQPIGLKEVGWAAADAAVGIGVLKVLRMGRSATVAGRSMSFSQRSVALGPALLRGSAVGVRLAKYGAPAALAYLALRHPSVLHSMMGLLAEKLGMPVPLVQVLGWTVVLMPLLYLLRLSLRPLVPVLAGGLKRAERALRGKVPATDTAGRG